MKKRLIYGIGIYHIQTKPGFLSGVLNIQPFRGRSQVGSDPSHFTAAAPPPALTWTLICLTSQTSHLTIRALGCCLYLGEQEENRRRAGGDPAADWKSSQLNLCLVEKSTLTEGEVNQ